MIGPNLILVRVTGNSGSWEAATEVRRLDLYKGTLVVGGCSGACKGGILHEARKMAAEERGSYCTCADIDRWLPVRPAAACVFYFVQGRS